MSRLITAIAGFFIGLLLGCAAIIKGDLGLLLGVISIVGIVLLFVVSAFADEEV